MANEMRGDSDSDPYEGKEGVSQVDSVRQNEEEEGSKSQPMDDLLSCKKRQLKDVAAMDDHPKRHKESDFGIKTSRLNETDGVGMVTLSSLGEDTRVESSTSLLAGHVTKAEKSSPVEQREEINPPEKDDYDGHEPPPDLPEIIRKKIERMGGTEPVLVIQKRLTTTDMNKNENRLSIPKGALKNEFLTDDEKASLDWYKIETVVLDIKGKEWTDNLHFAKWPIRPPTWIYVLSGPGWIKLTLDNRLAVGHLVQLWAFRVEGKLRFALFKLKEEKEY